MTLTSFILSFLFRISMEMTRKGGFTRLNNTLITKVFRWNSESSLPPFIWRAWFFNGTFGMLNSGDQSYGRNLRESCCNVFHTDFEDQAEALTCLRHTSTVGDYQEAFKKLSHRVDGLPESFLISCFMAGLKDEVQLDVKIKHSNSLAEAIEVAHLIEERNQLQRCHGPTLRVLTLTAPQPLATALVQGVLGPALTNRTRVPNFHRLSAQRRERDLCFYCDEKFMPEHHCAWPQLFMIEDAAEQSAEADDQTEEVEDDGHNLPEISFHTIVRTQHPQTIQVVCKLKNKDLTVLIDKGSTHNFIEQTMVTKFSLPVETGKKFQVMVANKE